MVESIPIVVFSLRKAVAIPIGGLGADSQQVQRMTKELDRSVHGIRVYIQ